MKGKATITLCDAASGRVVKQIEEHNMVTNALSSIFQPPILAALGGMDFSRALSSFLPMSKSLIGGLVLLGENIAEDASDFMLKPENSVVGHAGDAYSGTEVTRGTLNENESYATENGCHFTWDFPTDKANGVIRCCALTNKHFGNIGRAPENADGSLIVNPSFPLNTAATTADKPLTSQDGWQFVGMYEPQVLSFMRVLDGELLLRKVRLVDPGSILINDALGGVVEEEMTILAPFVPKNDRCYFVDTDKRLVYFFEATVSAPNTYLNYMGIDPLTGELLDFKSFVLDRTDTVQGVAESPKGLCVFGNSTVTIHGAGGTVIETFSFSGEKFFVSEGTLCLVGKKDGIHCVCCFTEEGPVYMRNNGYVPIESSFVTLPYTLYSTGTYASTAKEAHVMMLTNYLATINNLSEPLEKTPVQTLKVSYDITNT